MLWAIVSAQKVIAQRPREPSLHSCEETVQLRRTPPRHLNNIARLITVLSSNGDLP
jgi:hypothetical protein